MAVVRSVPRVRVLIPPQRLVQLLAWIRPEDDGGRGWWACVAWTEPGPSELVLRTGWVAAKHVMRAPGDEYRGVPRMRLPGEPAGWPVPVPLVGSYRWRGPHEHVGELYGQKLDRPGEGRRCCGSCLGMTGWGSDYRPAPTSRVACRAASCW
jgi:hypothetical protein